MNDRTAQLFDRVARETEARHPGLGANLASVNTELLGQWLSVSPSQSPELTSVSSFNTFVRRGLRSTEGERRDCALALLNTLGILTGRPDLRAAYDRTSALYAVR